jgi:hypothetical protein
MNAKIASYFNRVWQCQFVLKATPRQRVFDVVAGILMPVVFLLTDRFGFESIFADSSSAISQTAISFGVLVLLLWFLLGAWIGPLWDGVVAGILLSGAYYAFVVGMFLSFMGFFGLIGGVIVILQGNPRGFLAIGISLLGVLPFFTAFVFLRNGVRVILHIRRQLTRTQLVGMLFLGMVVVLLILTVVG